MTDPWNADRMLELLADEPQPKLSPYFEARLHRKLAEPPPPPQYARAVRWGALVLILFCAAILSSFAHLRWLIPLLILFCIPEDWGDAVARRFRPR